MIHGDLLAEQATPSMTSTSSIRWHQTSPGPTFPALFGGSLHPPGPTMGSCARAAGSTCLRARGAAWVSNLTDYLLTELSVIDWLFAP
jgi:hypothetical protein